MNFKMADDEVLDTWEDLEDSGELDRRLQNIKVKEVKVDKSSCHDRNHPVLQEDTQRSTFQPQVKILRRAPNNDTTSSADAAKNALGGNRGRKTLEEREAAYAEARLRIFGAAYSEEDETSGAGDYSDSGITQQLGALKVNDATGIIRQPRGPDGSKGFSSENRHTLGT